MSEYVQNNIIIHHTYILVTIHNKSCSNDKFNKYITRFNVQGPSDRYALCGWIGVGV